MSSTSTALASDVQNEFNSKCSFIKNQYFISLKVVLFYVTVELSKVTSSVFHEVKSYFKIKVM